MMKEIQKFKMNVKLYLFNFKVFMKYDSEDLDYNMEELEYLSKQISSMEPITDRKILSMLRIFPPTPSKTFY